MQYRHRNQVGRIKNQDKKTAVRKEKPDKLRLGKDKAVKKEY